MTEAALTALTVYVIARSSFNAAEQWQKYADINWIITDKWSLWTYDLDICLAFLPVLVMLLALLQFNYHELKYKQAQKSLAAAMSLSGIITSWADCYKTSKHWASNVKRWKKFISHCLEDNKDIINYKLQGLIGL